MSFHPPHVLSTCIATLETFGIIPLSTALAEKWKITVLPPWHYKGECPHEHKEILVHYLENIFTRHKGANDLNMRCEEGREIKKGRQRSVLALGKETPRFLHQEKELLNSQSGLVKHWPGGRRRWC
jgi:hypothetical protein